MRLAPVHLVLGATALCGLALFSARLEAEAGLGDTGGPRDTSDACADVERAPIEVKIARGESLVNTVNEALKEVDHESIDLKLEIAEGWTPHASDRTVSCYPIPPEMSVTVRVIGRDLEVTDDTLGDPANVNLMGLRLMQGPEGCDRKDVILQDVNLVGVCTNFTTGDTARLVVNDAWPVTLIDVDLNGLGSSSGDAAKYGLYATAGEIKANDLHVSEFSAGFGVKLTSDAVVFTQTDGAYKGNTWGGLGSFGATVALNGVSFSDNVLVHRAEGYAWDNRGGAIYAEGGTLSLTDVSFQRDSAPESGGSIALQSVSSFTGCGLSFIGSEAGSYGGAISAHHSYVTLKGEDAGCAPNLFSGVSAGTGAAMSLSQEGDGTSVSANLSGVRLSRLSGETAISSSLAGPLTLTDLTTPGGLGNVGLLHTDSGDGSKAIGPVTLTRLNVRGRGSSVPSGLSLIAVEKTHLTLTESTICGVLSGGDAAAMISITDPDDDSLLQRNTIWGGWSYQGTSAFVTAQDGWTTTKDTPTVRVIDNTFIGLGAETGVVTDQSVVFWGVNNLLNGLSIGFNLGGTVERLSHNLYGLSVKKPLVGNGADVATDEIAGKPAGLLNPTTKLCGVLPLLRSSSPAVGAGPGDSDSELLIYNAPLSYKGVPYNALDDIGAQPVELLDRDGDGYEAAEDCQDLDPAVNPGAEEVPGNGLDDDCDPGTTDTVPDEDPSDQDGDGVPDEEDCAPADARLAERCDPAIVEYRGGRAGCAAAPRAGGVLALALAFGALRRRSRRISPL